jgi:hypothetical protein
MHGIYLTELGADCCPEGRVLSAIRSFESRMAFSNFVTIYHLVSQSRLPHQEAHACTS